MGNSHKRKTELDLTMSTQLRMEGCFFLHTGIARGGADRLVRCAFRTLTNTMPKGTDVHVPPDRENDPLGYPALRIARSRKVQKGEDKSFETLDGRWVPLRLASDGSGAVVVSGGGPTDANSTGPDPDPASVVHFSAFGLFDGHGGKACAEHCASTMLAFVVDALDKQGPVPVDQDIGDAFESRLPQALKDGFEACDHAFLALDVHSGATATVVVVQGRSVTTACVGDSLAIIDLGVSCGFAGPAQRLSPEHRLDTSGPERDRILAFGGEVSSRQRGRNARWFRDRACCVA